MNIKLDDIIEVKTVYNETYTGKVIYVKQSNARKNIYFVEIQCQNSNKKYTFAMDILKSNDNIRIIR